MAQKEMLYLLHEAPREGIESTGDQKEFIQKCMSMVSKWNSFEIPCDLLFFEFGKHQERCQFAVNLALPSRRVEGDSYLMTSSFNNHSGSTLKQLPGININEPAINTYAEHRLFTCLLDFSVQTHLIKTAILVPQPSMDPTELPENVLAGPAATSTSASSTSVAPQPRAPATETAATTTSKTQRNLTVGERQPVRVPPPYPAWLSQFGADHGVPLATTAPEESVFNINANPPSFTRPIPSTSSSEAGSPTPTRILRSGARFNTVAYKVGSGGIVEQVARRRLPRSSDTQPLAFFAERIYSAHRT